MYINSEGKDSHTYDVIVIGSGISGGWAAKEFTEKGLKVLMLDRGKDLVHPNYPTAFKNPWEFKHRGRITVEQRRTHEYVSRDYPYNEHNEEYWFKDADAPYKEIKRFDWFRPDIVGGKSVMWGRQSYRWSDIDFEANAKDGIAVDWPIRYKDIAPWYDYVERFAGISGSKESLPQLPDGEFLPPMEMNCLEKDVKGKIETSFNGRKMIIGRVANLTEAKPGRTKCNYRNLCSRGCPFGAYFSSNSSTIPAALNTGNLTIRPNSVVASIIYDEKSERATGVNVIDAESMENIEYFSKIIFVNASTLGSTSILLNSISNRFPNGLGNDSGQLGHNLMDHHFRVGAHGISEDFDNQYYFGRRANGIYIPRFRNLNGEKRDYIRGFGYQGRAGRGNWSSMIHSQGFGEEFKEKLTKPGPWSFGIGAFGECLPYYENQVSLNPDKKDKWGLPTLIINAEFKENEKKMRVDMKNDASEMLKAAGLKNVTPYDAGSYPGMAIHEMGTARMGRDPKTSVLNKWNQVHAVKNVFVTDGASMVSTACQNPSLTYMALTARAANFAMNELNKRNI